VTDAFFPGNKNKKRALSQSRYGAFFVDFG